MDTIFGQKNILYLATQLWRSIYLFILNFTWTVWSLPDEWKFGMVVKSEFEQSARRNPEDHLQVQDEGHEDMKSARTRDSPTPYKQRRVNIGLCIFLEKVEVYQFGSYLGTRHFFLYIWNYFFYFNSHFNLLYIYKKLNLYNIFIQN